MNRLILAQRHPHDDGVPTYQAIVHFPAVLGRGLGCDVIIPDPYVAARQAVLRATDEGWEVSDLGGRNPTRLNGAALQPNVWQRLRSGDRLMLGRQQIDVFAPEHAVADTLPMPKEGGLYHALGRPYVALPVFLLTLATAAGWSYLGVWSDTPAMTVAVTVAGCFFVTLVWAGMWSVVGRLTTHRSRFLSQLGIVGLYIFVSLWLSALLVGADFLLSSDMTAKAISTGVQGLLLAWLAYGSLSVATELPRRRRLQGALGFAAGLVISIVCLGAISAQGFNPTPPFSTTLEPSLSSFAPAVDADTFITRSEKLFDDPLFDEDRGIDKALSIVKAAAKPADGAAQQ